MGGSFTDAPGGTAHWTFAGNTNYAPSADDALIQIAQAAAAVAVNGYSGVYDGRAHGHTIVDSPRAGTLLSADEIEALFLRFGGVGVV